MKKLTCRVCKSRKLSLLWDFGPSPLANSLLKHQDDPETIYPLQVNYCTNCGNVQLAHVIDPKILFSNYLYASSTSQTFIKHFEDFATKMNVRSVVDIGSNDGILLKPFQKKGVTVLGIEPAKNIASKASVPTVNAFFTPKLAKKIGRVDLVTCTNTFAHIDDIDSVTRGVKIMIGSSGTFVVEVQYLQDQVKYHYFDNVYHEHVQYWTVTALNNFFRRHKLTLYKVEHINTHGGSIRVYVSKNKPVEKSVGTFISRESKVPYKRLQRVTEDIKTKKFKLLSKLLKLKSQGKKIAGYGAPAKATTLSNYFGIGKDLIDFVVDDSPIKQGLFTPGKHIPIVSSETLYKEKPDYVLILAWNFAKPIMAKHPKFKFIVPDL